MDWPFAKKTPSMHKYLELVGVMEMRRHGAVFRLLDQIGLRLVQLALVDLAAPCRGRADIEPAVERLGERLSEW